ncbi:MAG: hypothetical protein KF778_10110 [Rhodocyclaceae bacterium]|nr:hypothetical protein [Rhodocyclaceae bacterium]MBX3668743.1 hypothetical protein [Rhodocyclaceae bacterium]
MQHALVAGVGAMLALRAALVAEACPRQRRNALLQPKLGLFRRDGDKAAASGYFVHLFADRMTPALSARFEL